MHFKLIPIVFLYDFNDVENRKQFSGFDKKYL